MGLSDIFGNVYAKFEDVFYSFLDFLDEKGLPVYGIVDPLEERGIPALPLALAVVLIAGFFAYSFLFVNTAEIEVGLDIANADGTVHLNGVQLSAGTEDGKELELGGNIFSHGQKIFLTGAGLGQRITFRAKKEGFLDASFELKLTGKGDTAILRLQEDLKVIRGQLRLVDPTGDFVERAQVIAKFKDDSSVICANLGNGVFECSGVVEGEPVELIVSSSNYETLPARTEFFEGSQAEFVLAPKPQALAGKTNLIVRVLGEETQKAVENANIKIFDAKDDEIIFDVMDADGEYLAKIERGTSVRIAVSAQNFARYDSTLDGIERTLRADEELWTVQLKPGGVTVSVVARDASGLPQSEVEVQLFNFAGEKIDSKPTGFGGEVVFDNLKSEDNFFITGYKAGFLPARKEIVPLQEKEVNLDLERATPENSSKVQVFVLTKDGLAANGAILNFFEIANGVELPLGIPAQKSDASGKANLNMPAGKQILARAVKGNLQGEDQTEIKTGEPNELFIELEKSAEFVDLKLVDAKGEAVKEGHVRVESMSGEILFDLDLEGASEDDLFFDPIENDFVELVYLSPQNNTFSTQVYVKGLKEVVVTISDSAVEGFGPAIEFKGVFDISGKPVDGINKGQDYYLYFEANFPEGDGKHGVHVRVGGDTVKYADSQDAGIVGFSAVGATPFFGRTYSPLPAPGLESVDYSNEGHAGSYNKWLELYFEEGGVKLVKVRVSAKETASDADFELHYRAWSQFGSSFNRAPSDNIIGAANFSSQKSGLYAATSTEKVRIFETTSNCRQEICASYRFLEKDGLEIEAQNFNPIVNDLFALEITINPLNDIDATIKATTSKSDPKLFFQGYAVDGASVFPDNNKTDTSIEVSGLLSPAGKALKVLLFFKTIETGSTSITVQTISSDTVLNDNFFFEIFSQKLLKVEIEPSEVKFGEDFRFIVMETGGAPVEDASIVLSDFAGAHLETIVGTKTTDKGKDGIYIVKNSFDTGIIKYAVMAPQFRPESGEIQIFRDNVLSAPQTIEVTILAGKKDGEAMLEVENTSDELVESIAFEIKRIGNFPKEMSLKADPIVLIAPNSVEKIKLKAGYSGKEKSAHGEAILIVRGRVGQKFNVSAQTKVIIDYNPPIAQNCIEFSKAALVVLLESGRDKRAFYDEFYNNSYYQPTIGEFDYSRVNQNLGLTAEGVPYYDSARNFNNYDYSFYGLNPTLARYTNEYLNPINKFYGYNNSKQVEFLAKNNCNVEIELTPEVIARSPVFDDGIKVDVGSLKLGPTGSVQGGKRLDQQTVKVTVTNALLRNYPSLSSFGFDIFFGSLAITKSIPLNVLIWDPVFGLEFVRNIELWLAQEAPTLPARAQSPIFMRNVGQSPIENIALRQTSGGFARGNVNVRIEPAHPVRLLPIGLEVLPPRTAVAEATRAEKTTPLDMKIISVTGQIDGKQRDFGPIFVTTHVSGFECLSAVPNSLEFSSKKTGGAVSKTVNVKNSCAEEVRITDVSPNVFGANTLHIAGSGIIIPPGSQTELELIFSKEEEGEQKVAVTLDSFLVKSARFIQSNPINVDIRIGETALAAKAGFEEKNILVCETGEKRAVQFPKIATTPDCENAYCDAELLAEFLVQKASEKLKEANRQIANYKSDIKNTGCDQAQVRGGYCGFGGFGVRTESYSVFFQNDQLTPELLKKIANEKGSGLGKFRVEYIVGKDVGPLIGQIGNKILLNGTVAGCGRYRVTFDGAVKVVSGRLDSELINILIDFLPEEQEEERATTAQCLPRIQNLMNFLPQDKSFKGTDSTGETWLGLVQAQNSGLEGIAKEIAQGLFGHSERLVDNAEGSNHLNLAFGAPAGYLARIEMDKESGVAPRKFRVQVKETGLRETATSKETEIAEKIELQNQPALPNAQPGPSANQPIQPAPGSDTQPIQREPTPPPSAPTPAPTTGERLRGEIEKETARAIVGLKKNAIDGCISQNEDYLLLKSEVEISGYEIELGACTDQLSGKPGLLTLVPGSQACCEYKASSPISEKIVPNFIATDIAGISGTKLLQNQQEVAKREVELAEKDQKTNKYAAKLLLCTTASEKDFVQARGKAITLEARSAKNEERKATAKTVSLEICGIHPNRLFELIQKEKDGTYYATLVWSGEPETIHYQELGRAAETKAHLEGFNALNATGNIGAQTEIEAQKSSKRQAGIGVYLGACVIGSSVAGWKLGFFWPLDVVFNCGVPALIASIEAFPTANKAYEFVVDTIKEIPLVGPFAEFIGSLTKTATDTLRNPETANQSELDELYIAALPSVLGYTGGRILQNTIDPVTPGNLERVAAELSSQLTETLVKDEFRSIPSSTKFYLREVLRREILNAGRQFVGKAKLSTALSGAQGATVLDGIIVQAFSQSVKDEPLLAEIVKNKDNFVKLSATEQFKEATKKLEAQVKNTAELKGHVSDFGETISVNNDAINPKIADATDFTTQKGVLADKYISENRKAFTDFVKKNFDDDFFNANRTQLESTWEQSVRKYIQDNTGIKKTPVTPPRGPIEYTFETDFTPSNAKRAMQTGVDEVFSNTVIEQNAKDFVAKKAAAVAFPDMAKSADSFIKLEGGKYKIKYAKLQNLLHGPATLNFWKTMGKGIFTGAIANGIGLAAYKQFMDKHGGIEGAPVEITNKVSKAVDSDGDGTADTTILEETRDRTLVKYGTYKIEIRTVDGKKKPVIGEKIEPELIPSGAQRIQECNSESLLEGYTGIPNISPSPRTFKEAGVSKANIKAAVNYYEKGFGRMLKDINVEKTYRVPEALVVTVAAWHTGMGEEKGGEWIAGCSLNNLAVKEPAANFRCAAKKLGKFFAECKEEIKCTLQKYHEEKDKSGAYSNKHYATKVDYGGLEKIYNLWNLKEFRVANIVGAT